MVTSLKQHYGSAEGPLGFPMMDRQAIVVDSVLKSLPKGREFEYRRIANEKLIATETLSGERSDVSWITTEDPDRQNEVVIAKGINDSQFALNPIVTLNHCYSMPPVGKSLWRKRCKDGSRVGVKAKTLYPPTPASWPAGEEWPPDCAFSLVQSELLRGKSIGFLPTAVHVPSEKERSDNGWKNVSLVIDEWILLEYACVFLPAQQNAIVESVSKSLGTGSIPEAFAKALGLKMKQEETETTEKESSSVASVFSCSFICLSEIEKALIRRIRQIDLSSITNRAAMDALDRYRGRV
jgi:hypothetical protein